MAILKHLQVDTTETLEMVAPCLKFPRHPTNITESSIKIMGAKLWNKLDKALKSITKAKKFKSKFKMSRIKAYKLKISHKP